MQHQQQARRVLPRTTGGGGASTAPQQQQQAAAKLIAAAGRDLFRQSLAFDGVQPQHQAPRHPAISPTLGPIPEDDDAADGDAHSSTSQAILVVGGASSCVERASQLYWGVTRAYAERQADAHCYLVPVADELGADGVRECEAIRNALIAAGVSPHHIVMTCSASSVVTNVVQLVAELRHLHVEHVHVVVGQFDLPRVQLCVDRILRAAGDMTFKTQYHTTPDGLPATERAKDTNALNNELDAAITQMRKQRHWGAEGLDSSSSSSSYHSANVTRNAARTSRTSTGA